MPGFSLGLGALIGGALSAGSALAGTAMRNEAQKRESELAYQRERVAIKEQNAYNSASAQVARLQAAGLNPNMMYNQSQEAAAGTQQDIARYQPADIENAVGPLGAIGSDMIQSMIGLKDIQNKSDLAAADIALKSMSAYREYTQGDLNVSQKQSLLQSMGFDMQRFPYELAKLQWDIENSKKDYQVKEVSIDTMKKSWELTDAQISELAASANLKMSQALEILYLLEPHRQEIMEHINLMRSEGKLNVANCQVAFANSEYLQKLSWEVTQRYYLDQWKAQQDVTQRGVELANQATQIQLFDKYENRRLTLDWTKFGVDTLFQVADLTIKLLPLLMKTPKIGF